MKLLVNYITFFLGPDGQNLCFNLMNILFSKINQKLKNKLSIKYKNY